MFSLLSDKIETSTDCRAQDINITGGQEQHQQHVRNQVAMEVTIMDRAMEEMDHAMKLGSRNGRQETRFARNLAFSKSIIKADSAQDTFVAGVAGRIIREHPEEEAHADGGVLGGDHERAFQDKEHDGVKYKPFLSLMNFWKGYCGEENSEQLPGSSGGQDGQIAEEPQAGGGRLQAGGEQAGKELDCGEHHVQPVAVEQQAVVGDGFQVEFKKITRAGRRCTIPDGRIQILLDNFVVKRGEGSSNFENSVLGAGKKRSAECELNLRIKKARN